MSSPTARTLKFERDRGNTAQVVEHWNPFARRRVDLFNCIDVVVLKEGRVYGVQVTSGSNHSARIKKAQTTPAILQWVVDCGGGFQVQSWKKVKGRWPKAPRISEATDGSGALDFYEVTL